MPPSFVIEFASLLLLGPDATLLIVAAATVTQMRAHPLRRLLSTAVTIMLAVEAAGFALRVSGGTTTAFVWPWQGLPIAVAVITYSTVKRASGESVGPVFARHPINRSWPRSVVIGCLNYVVGAGIAVGVVDLIQRQLGGVVPVGAVPVDFGYHA